MKTPSFSLTFSGVCLLAARYFGFFLLVSLTARFMASTLMDLNPPSHAPLFALVALLALFAGTILSAASNAALVCRLAEPGPLAWSRVMTAVHDYTWVFFRISFLIALVVVLCFVPFGLVFRWAPSLRTLELPAIVFLFVFIKYSLAYPIAYIENTTAQKALARSWEMTRGRFRYVCSCYLAMAAGNYLLLKFLGSSWVGGAYSIAVFSLIQHAVLAIVESIWIILGWQMYVDIRSCEQVETLPVD